MGSFTLFSLTMYILLSFLFMEHLSLTFHGRDQHQLKMLFPAFPCSSLLEDASPEQGLRGDAGVRGDPRPWFSLGRQRGLVQVLRSSCKK